MKEKIFKYIRDNKLFLLGLFLVIVYLSPALILGKNATILVHDNLDSEVVYRVVLHLSGQALAFSHSATIANVMNGLPRDCFVGALNATLWLFLLLRPIWAYLVNDALVHLVAYVGMFLLTQYHLLKKPNVLISSGVALCFAILPFYSILGLVVAGQPILLYAFLNLLKGRKGFWNYLIILLFPFTSSLIYSFFIIIALVVIYLIRYLKTRKIEKSAWLALLAFTLLSLAVDFQLFSQFFFTNGFVSHRVEWNPTLWSISLAKIWPQTWSYLLDGQYHAASQSRYIVLVFLPVALVLAVWKKRPVKKILGLALLGLLICFFASFYLWDGLIGLKERVEILNVFAFERFHLLLPLIFFAIFALVLETINMSIKNKIFATIVIALMLLGQIGYTLGRDDFFKTNLYNLKLAASHQPIKSLTFERFFSESLFGDIASFIGKSQDSYRVVGIKLEPTITQYNGFYTLDGYQNNYPLDYKRKFRRIIAAQLDKSEPIREYFDYWGSRCYITEVTDINYAALKELGGNYIFSTIEISDPPDQIEFMKKFESVQWNIYLYRIK